MELLPALFTLSVILGACAVLFGIAGIIWTLLVEPFINRRQPMATRRSARLNRRLLREYLETVDRR